MIAKIAENFDRKKSKTTPSVPNYGRFVLNICPRPPIWWRQNYKKVIVDGGAAPNSASLGCIYFVKLPKICAKIAIFEHLLQFWNISIQKINEKSWIVENVLFQYKLINLFLDFEMYFPYAEFGAGRATASAMFARNRGTKVEVYLFIEKKEDLLRMISPKIVKKDYFEKNLTINSNTDFIYRDLSTLL